MNYKFTADGKKVVVIGALNTKETIVQEIFVCDGAELPAGEQFIVKSLLDKPAETYKVREEKRLESRIKELESECGKLRREISNFRQVSAAATAKLQWIKGIRPEEVEDAVNRIEAFLSGEITHILFTDYELEIIEVGLDGFSQYDNHYGDRRFEGIRLVSLFGNYNKRLPMDWKLNDYRDGSGNNKTFIPCKSMAEAISAAKEIIYAKEHLTKIDFDFCVKHGIPVDEVKNTARIEKEKESLQVNIDKYKKTIIEWEEAMGKLK